MKKIILFILLSSFLFIKPDTNVLADSSSPVLTWYEAIITNPSGAKTYDNYWNPNQLDVVIPYESEVIVLQEYSNYNVLYNNKEYWISNEDIAPKNEDFPLEKATKLDEKSIAFTRYEMNVYSGPSAKFKKVGTLPSNTEFSYEYVPKSGGAWVYIEYDNIKGWILASGERGGSMLAYKTNTTIKLLENYENEYTKISIPKGTVLNCFYIYSSGRGPNEYQVEYNGNKIWIFDSLNGESIFEITDNENTIVPETPNEDMNDNKQEENLPNNENTTIPETPNEDINDNKQEENLPNNENNKLDFYTILYLSIGAAVLVSLTALVTIILMNKKNKNNNDSSINNNQANINQQNNINSSTNEVINQTNVNNIKK